MVSISDIQPQDVSVLKLWHSGVEFSLEIGAENAVGDANARVSPVIMIVFFMLFPVDDGVVAVSRCDDARRFHSVPDILVVCPCCASVGGLQDLGGLV